MWTAAGGSPGAVPPRMHPHSTADARSPGGDAPRPGNDALGPNTAAPGRGGTGVTVHRIDGILMPGMVNAHCHTPMVLLRGAGEGLPVGRWLHEVMWPPRVEAHRGRRADRDAAGSGRDAVQRHHHLDGDVLPRPGPR